MGHAGPSAQVVLPCADLDATLAFFTERLGFRLDAIFPADAPRVAEISGHGLRLRLERGSSGSPAVLRLACEDPTSFADGATELTAPNGTRIEIVAADAALVSPPNKPSVLLSRMRDEWGIKLSLRTIFEAATLGDLALAAADAGARAVETLPDTLSETADDAKALLERLDELTNEEVDALLLQMDMGGTARK